MKKTLVPIAILHRNEPDNLALMLESISVNTRYPHKVFVVDNCSDPEVIGDKLEMLQQQYGFVFIRSSRNNWLLGFNAAIAHDAWPRDAQYCVLSDSDIVLPSIEESSECWLTHMVSQMEAHACIGKLGIALRTDDIDNTSIKETVRKRESRFRRYPQIGANYIAPVDTTLALYRHNFFVGRKFRMRIGHASLARPYFYTCRTSDEMQARHLGWYSKTSIQTSSKVLSEKVRCFARYGAYIEKETLKAAEVADRIYYKVVHPLARCYWGIAVLLNISVFLVSRYPRSINEIQAQCK
jgi:glycosyltransferase involved in cell wall biosynthesis